MRTTQCGSLLPTAAAPFSAARCTFFGPLLVTLSLPKGQHVRMCADAEGDAVRRAVDAASADVAATSASAAAAFDALEARAAARLAALGTDEPAAPAAPAFTRSEFSISRGSAAKKAEAEEKVRLMRRKETGELELANVDAIRMARSMAGQWLDAGLAQRAEEELKRVAKFVSYKTDVGASFHLELAAILAKQSGREAEAKRIYTRVMQDASSSSLRWQAEQLLSRAGGSFQRASQAPANEELNKLFKMPEW